MNPGRRAQVQPGLLELVGGDGVVAEETSGPVFLGDRGTEGAPDGARDPVFDAVPEPVKLGTGDGNLPGASNP